MGLVHPTPTVLEKLIRRIYRKMAILYLPAPPAEARRAYGSEPGQFGDLRLPPGPGAHPVLIAIHGGFWRAKYGLDHLGHLCASLTTLGLATWNLEYSRIGQSGGGWSGTCRDVWKGARYLETLRSEYPLDIERVAVIGHSAGGHLALWLAAALSEKTSAVPVERDHPGRLRLKAAISLAGVSDLVEAWKWDLGDGVVSELMGGSPAQFPDRYAAASPMACLPIGIPQILIHGRLDETVPFSFSERYAMAAESCGDPVRLVPLEGLGHFEPIDPRSAAWPVVSSAVMDALK